MATTSPLARIPLPQSSDTDQVPADLLTEAAYFESMLVTRFASAAERTTYLTAAGLGTGVRGMVTDNAATGLPERFNGTAWVSLVPENVITGTAVVKGTTWDGVTQRIKQRLSVVTTTSNVGGFSINFTPAFPNGIFSVQLTAGDNAANLAFLVPNVTASALAYWQGIAYTPVGAAINTGGIRIEVDAIGW